ncbi:MAG: hypothetical protein M1814_004868 [Vezdaea aestivalis]|nr:MAG: hypothetical protein M1814_004868 [Vezdaea aestivalis]
MGPKRPSTSASSAGTPAKNQKTDDPQEFSRSVQRKLANSTRTGQACDRCKIRKIRCDGLQGGCSPCIQNSTECRTTDRITGVATSRGYVQNLEQQTKEMADRIHELEDRLAAMGVDVKPSSSLIQHSNGPQPMEWSNHNQTQWPTNPPNSTQQSAGSRPYSTDRPLRQQETNMFRALPVFRSGSCGENYLGVSSGNSRLSSINGTSLSLLGMEIDIADFPSPDMDEPPPSMFQQGLYNKSYQSLLQTMYNVNPKLEKPALPVRSEGLQYADWFFRVLNPYLPVLHRPSFVALLQRTYDDPTFRPTAAEVVMVHMTFAIMFFQYAARNFEDSAQQAELNAKSNLHYHYALGFFYDLRVSRTLKDIQALALICSHLRNFSKPGASWHVTNATLAHAIEQGLHRSSKRWAPASERPNFLEEEMRKRVFYSVFSIHILLSGKLGRPMALRPDDFDIELPESIDDEYISETGIAQVRPNPCTFQIGIEACKQQLLCLQLYTSLYSVKRDPAVYEETVKRLEAAIVNWRDNLPPQFRDEAQTNQEGKVFALYTKMWYLEFRLLLRHPAISLSASKGFNSDSLDICVDCATCMLETVKILQKYKSLDTTWYNGAVYIMAITTTLFVAYERQNSGNPMDLGKLREEMNQWVEIMGEVGVLLGSGRRLQETVRIVTDGTLNKLARGEGNRGRSSRRPSKSPDPVQAGSRKGSVAGQYSPGPPKNEPYLSPDPNRTTTSPAFQPQTIFQYPDPASTNQGNPYAPGAYGDAGYGPPTGETSTTTLTSVSTMVSGQPSPVFHPNIFSTDAAGTVQMGSDFGPMAWRQWAGTMTCGLEPSEAEPASALLSLRELSSAAGPSAPMVTMAGQPINPAEVAVQPWPLMVFDMGVNDQEIEN